MASNEREPGGAEKRYWLDDPANIKKIVWALVAICAGLFMADALYEKHGYFEIEQIFGFYAVFGFVVYVALVTVAKWLRTILKRPEDYYERDD